MKSIEEQIVD